MTMRLIFLGIIAVICFGNAGAKSDKGLKFDENGRFKILQFTDVHFKYNSYRSDSALAMMKRAVVEEKPGLVVLTGDIVCSSNTPKAWLVVAKIFEETKVPWAVTLGNHDVEQELSGRQITGLIDGLPYCLTKTGPENISGSGNGYLKIQSSVSGDTKAVVWLFDSHSGLDKEKGYGGYDWIKHDQVQWYFNESRKLTKSHAGKPFPALAFFHIPLAEYNEAWEKGNAVGRKEESVCSPEINSGLYTAFIESKDVMGVFVGHDHNNNYIGNLRNICLAYGQASGRECYGQIGKGYRVVELYEDQRRFDTWVAIKYHADRDKDIWEPVKENEKRDFVTFPGSFAKTK